MATTAMVDTACVHREVEEEEVEEVAAADVVNIRNSGLDTRRASSRPQRQVRVAVGIGDASWRLVVVVDERSLPAEADKRHHSIHRKLDPPPVLRTDTCQREVAVGRRAGCESPWRGRLVRWVGGRCPSRIDQVRVHVMQCAGPLSVVEAFQMWWVRRV